MPITPVEAKHQALEVARLEIGCLAVERAALINDFERRQTLRSSTSSSLTDSSGNRARIAVIDMEDFLSCSACSRPVLNECLITTVRLCVTRENKCNIVHRSSQLFITTSTAKRFSSLRCAAAIQMFARWNQSNGK
jgi:hypothetical protein